MLNIEHDEIQPSILGNTNDSRVSKRAKALFRPDILLHLDTTALSFHGAYDEEDESNELVSVAKGYSKNANPQLNQVAISLMCTRLKASQWNRGFDFSKNRCSMPKAFI
jgi:transposase